MNRIIHKNKTKEELAEKAAQLFCDIVSKAIQQKGRAFVALSGGSTPQLLYQELVDHFSKKVDWAKVTFFCSDERTVPSDHPDSNMGMAMQYLFKPLNISKAQLHFYATDQTPEQAAKRYQKDIQDTVPHVNDIPQFDLIILGMGDDGHTASLFPDTNALHEKKQLVVENWIEKLNTWRLTFTFPLLNHAKNILFLVAGENKKQRVLEIFNQHNNQHPAAQINAEYGRTFWLLDDNATLLI